MTEVEIYEEEGAEVVPAGGTLFHTDDPVEIVERATRTANALADVVKGQKLATKISGREHVRVEGWTLLGSMLGVFPVVVWTREIKHPELGNYDGWEARVEARTRDGAIVGAAEAECRRSEKTWEKRDSFALRSMAQTRATSKALRHPLGFVMTLAGFEAMPAEEMPRDEPVVVQERLASNWRQVLNALDAANVTSGVEWMKAACLTLGIATLEDASMDQKADVLARMNVVLNALEPWADSRFPPPSVDDVQKAFAAGFDGVILEPPSDPEPELEDEDIPWPEDEVPA